MVLGMTTVVDTCSSRRQNRQISRIGPRCGTVLSCHAAKHRTSAPAATALPPASSPPHRLKMSPATGSSGGY